jgi:hypothetical protein
MKTTWRALTSSRVAWLGALSDVPPCAESSLMGVSGDTTWNAGRRQISPDRGHTAAEALRGDSRAVPGVETSKAQ